jgi:hypothetical protein
MSEPYQEEFPHQSQQKFRLRDWLHKRDLGKRLLIGLIFVFSLTFFLHYREVRLEVLELGSIADRYVIAQIDFEFPDDEATIVLRQESIHDIGRIYKIDEKQAVKKRFELEDFLIHHQEWREQLPKVTFEELYYGADHLKDALLQTRFTDERTLEKIKLFDLPSDNFYLLASSSVSGPMKFDEALWKKLTKEAFAEQRISPEAMAYLIAFFADQSWNLSNDTASERNLRQSIQEGLPDILTRVQAGSRMIDSGEEITPRHLVMMKAMKNAIKQSRKLWQPLPILGSFLLALIFTGLSVTFLRIKNLELIRSPRKLTLLCTITLLTLGLSKITEYFLLNHESNLIDYVSYPLLVPLASLLLSVLLGMSIALYISAFLSIILGVSLAFDHAHFLVINLIAGLLAIVFARQMHKRKEIFTVCGKVWLASIPVIIAYNLVQNRIVGVNMMADLSSSFIFMVATAILVIGLLPLFESIFQVMTDMSLMEYMDPNNELLRRLSVEAPGTYQHCLVVGNIAEAAARAINANGLFCRVSTLYHDIGKLFNPHYFTENQLGGLNIHQLLTPKESTQVIISHVKEGEELARKFHLPGPFIDVIREHHGTTLVYYFYCKQVEQMGGDPSKVDESCFRYLGPKPHSKESAIIMIADSIEAASRSLSEFSEEGVTEMVDRLVKEKADDGQFDECNLSFADLGMVKKTIVQTLMVSHHLRVRYPHQKH